MESLVTLREILFGSLDHQAAITLRSRVLREPLGLQFSHEELLREREDFHLGAFEGKILRACLILKRREEAGWVQMRQVAVDPSIQRAGWGRTLVLFAEEFARAREFETMVLNAREAAIPFYEKLNYEIISEPINEIGIPHRKMSKKLS